MEVISVILFIYLLLCFIICSCSENIYHRILYWFCTIICCVLLTIVIITHIYKTEPTALDVYEGKTTLEITYRDSIPVDSVVVWKDEFKK